METPYDSQSLRRGERTVVGDTLPSKGRKRKRGRQSVEVYFDITESYLIPLLIIRVTI